MNRKIECLLFALLFVSWGMVTYAQERRTVTGSVRDSAGAGLTGASIAEKGTNNNVMTDQNGNYSIKVMPNATLVISYVGYTSKQIAAVDGAVTLLIPAEGAALNEVVVTGFGARRQTRKLSYATQQINAQDLVTAVSPNVVTSLQGKLSGVRIDQGTGGAASSPRIRIRGNTSLNGNQSPLYVVDGVLIKPTVTGPETWSDNNNTDPGNITKNLNNEDIESISVLKGSAASALYGSDAQNGVILITTKKGRAGKGLGVNVNVNSLWDHVYKGPDLQYEYGGGTSTTFAKDAQGNPVVDPSNGAFYNYGPKIDPSLMVKDLDGRMRPWQAYHLTDWFETGRQNNYNVALQGGTDRGSLRAAYSKSMVKGVIPNGAEFDRNTFTFRGVQKFARVFNIDVSATYVRTKNQNPIRQVSNYNPLFRMTYYRSNTIDWDYWKNNYINTTAGGRISGAADPYGVGLYLWTTFQNNQYTDDDNLRANIDLTTTIRPWLSLLTRANMNNYQVTGENKYLGDQPGYGNGSYRHSFSDQKSYRLQAVLTATKDLTKDISLSLSAGGERNKDRIGDNISQSTNNGLTALNPFYFSLNNSIGPVTTTQGFNPSRLRDAIYAYGDVSWRNLLTLNFSVRNEYSSTLTYANGTGDYSYLYPSIGSSFIFSDLLHNKSTFGFLSFGQLRLSYGETGKDLGAWVLNRLGVYSLNGTTQVVSGPNGGTTTLPSAGFSGDQLPGKNIKNEKTKEYEIGLNLKFLNNRLGIDVTGYQKNTFNQILGLPIPSETGGNSAQFNVGQVRNRGIELLINAEPVRTKNFNWNFNVNFTRNKNTIIDLATGVTSYELLTAFGNDVRAVAQPGYEYGAVYSSYGYAYYQAVDASGNPVSDPKNGMKVIGNPPNGSDGLSFLRAQDYKYNLVKTNYLGSIMEKFIAGTYHTFQFKGFTLNVQVDAKVGGLMASGTHQYGGSNGSFTYSLFGRDKAHGGIEYTDAQGNKRDDGIIPEGVFAQGITSPITGVSIAGMTWKEAFDKGLIKPKPALDYYEDLTQWSSGIREFSVFENSWVALREVSVGYNLPRSISSKMRFNNLRLNLIGRNLTYIWKNAKGGINPEGLSSNNPAAFAEYGGLPYIRNLGVSLNADF